jgi:cbb3-type cytochrome oxidase maturation protein
VSVLFVVVPLAILLVAVFVGFYVWSARTGQFDDLVTPAMRVLHDDTAPPKETDDGSKPDGTNRSGRGER